MEVIKLDRLVKLKVHSPRVDGYPVYLRVDGNMEDGDNGIKPKSEKWENVAKRKYTSPDNVRRVFITYKGVYVHLYKPVVGTGTSLHLKKDFNEDLQTICREVRNKTGKYKVTGKPLSAIFKPWVCSNIEEVYFDWSIFMSEDMMNLGYGDILKDYISKEEPKEIPVNIIKGILLDSCSLDERNLHSRYPRLRTVGYIQELEAIYGKAPKKPGMESLEDIKVPWCINGYVKDALDKKKATIWRVEGVPTLNTKHSMKENIYVFDRDILSKYFKELEERIIRHSGNADKKKDKVEILFDEIYNTSGGEGVRKAVKIALVSAGVSDKKELMGKLSVEGLEKYKQYIE